MSETKCRANTKSTDVPVRADEAAPDTERRRHQKNNTIDNKSTSTYTHTHALVLDTC